MANTSLSTLRSKGRAEMKIDRVGRVWSDTEWNDAINEAILEIQNKGDFKWDENQKTTTFNSVANQQEYDLATLVTDFVGLDLVKYNTKKLGSVDFLSLKATYQTFPSGTPTDYYLFGGDLGLNPIPTTVKVIDLTYRGILSDLTDGSDLSPFGTNFDRAIITYACYALLIKPADNRNVARANVKLARFKEIVARLYKTYLLKDKGQIIAFKSTYIPRSRAFGVNRNRFRNN